MTSEGVSLCCTVPAVVSREGARRGGRLGRMGQERHEGGRVSVDDGRRRRRRKTDGRKLQAEEGRCETRANISEMSRCWTLVSWDEISM